MLNYINNPYCLGLNKKIHRLISVILILFCMIANAKPPLQLANVYPGKQHAESELSEYWVSEKLDGVRGYWDGTQLLSRQGYRIHTPDWFVADLGIEPLDGELWIKRDEFDVVSSIIRANKAIDSEWKQIKFMIFDIPAHPGRFDVRVIEMQQRIKQINHDWIIMIPQIKILTPFLLDQHLKSVVQQKGEGLMLHKGNAYYQAGRTDHLLKLKMAEDQEGTVIGYTEGKGKYIGMMGALLLELENGKHFKLGSGFSDAQRRSPPQIGERVTFAYNGLTKKGLPRFARFLRVRKEDVIQE